MLELGLSLGAYQWSLLVSGVQSLPTVALLSEQRSSLEATDLP